MVVLVSVGLFPNIIRKDFLKVHVQTNYFTCHVQHRLLYCSTPFHPKARPVTGVILLQELTVRGFGAQNCLERWPEAFKEIEEWIQEVKYHVNTVKVGCFETVEFC